MESRLKSGWLDKRGKRLKGKHRRFFMLVRTGELWSCKDQYGKGMKVSLRLKKDQGEVQPLSAHSSTRSTPRHREPRGSKGPRGSGERDGSFAFVVSDNSGHTIRLFAPREAERDAWIAALNGIIEGRDLDEIANSAAAAAGGPPSPTSKYATATALGLKGSRVGRIGTAHGANKTASELQLLRAAQREEELFAHHSNLQNYRNGDYASSSRAGSGLTMSQLETKSDWTQLVQHTIPLSLEKINANATNERLSPLDIQRQKVTRVLAYMAAKLFGDSTAGDGASKTSERGPFTLVADGAAHFLLENCFNLRKRYAAGNEYEREADDLDNIFGTTVTLDHLSDRRTDAGKSDLVLYVLRPDHVEPRGKCDSGELLVEDYVPGVRPFAKDKVAVLFLAPATMRLLGRLSTCGMFRARLTYTPSIFHARHVCIERQAITMNMRTALEDLYSASGAVGSNANSPSRSPFEVADELVQGLVSMCAQLNEYPYIRYSTTSINCGMLAGKFYEALHEFIQEETSFDFHGSHDLRNRATVILLDRNCDLKQPLLHDPCLQPCAYDYLGRQHLVRSYLEELNERNPEWELYRHESLVTVWKLVQNRLANSVYRDEEQRERLSVIARICTEVFDRMGGRESSELESFDNLRELVMLEQTMVTGVDWRGPPEVAAVTARVIDQSTVSDRFLTVGTSEDTLTRQRLLGLFLLTYPDISESVATRVIDCMSLSDRIQAIDNLRQVPKPIDVFTTRQDPRTRIKIETEAAMRCSNSEDALDRNYPEIVNVANHLVIQQLSLDEYPYVRDPPPMAQRQQSATVSLRNSRSTLSNGVTLNRKTKGPRVFVVVLGGATFTELRHLYEQSRQTGVQLILVSTHFLTARSYLQALKNMETGQ